MTPDQFFATYDKRVHMWAKYTTKQYRLPHHMAQDLHQACYLALPSRLKTWKPGGKSPFNWCAPQMKVYMLAEIRRYHSNKPFSWRQEITYFMESVGDREFAAPITPEPWVRIDINNLLATDRKQGHLERFLRIALDPTSGADLARETGRTRQAINHSVRQTHKRLQKSCHEYKDYTPTCMAASVVEPERD